jgi:hypothetical protein
VSITPYTETFCADAIVAIAAKAAAIANFFIDFPFLDRDWDVVHASSYLSVSTMILEKSGDFG